MTAASHVPPLEHADIKGLDPKAWLARLRASILAPELDGRLYPGFPDEGTQKAFVGSAYEDALDEGFRFYEFVRGFAPYGPARSPNRYLDFGCGWGRISRFFLRDFERGDMAGVDVDPGMVAFCQSAASPGSHFTVRNGTPLPFADGAFQLVTAYSVFTHLPEPLFRAWMTELLRVIAPGGLLVFTVEPERFLDFVAAIDVAAPASGWHAGLAAKLGDPAIRRRELKQAGLTYLPTGGGPYRPVESYGDTVVSAGFIDSAIEGLGRQISYLDDPSRFWQAVSVVRRRHRRYRPDAMR